MIDLRDGVPGVNAPDPTTYDEFWPYYVSQHLHPTTRAVHVGGTTAGLLVALAALVAGPLWLLALAPVVGYGCAFSSHYLVEGNKPATFGNPAWSFRADFHLLGRTYVGHLGEDVRAVRAALGLRPEQRTLADAEPGTASPANA